MEQEQNQFIASRTDEIKASILSLTLYVLGFEIGIISLIFSLILKNMNDLSLANSLLMFLTYFTMAFILIFINFKIIKFDFKRIIKDKSFLVIIAGFGALYLTSVIISAITNVAEANLNMVENIFSFGTNIDATGVNQESIETSLQSNGMIFTFLAAAIFGPFVEEMIFRKSLFNILKADWLGFLASTVFFTMIHVVSSIESLDFMSILLVFLNYYFLSIVFGLIYIKAKKNVICTIIIHMAYNTLAMIALFI